MADSLVLTGVKDVRKHTGTEMLLTRPKRGGDTHSLKEWWKGGAGKCYVQCTVFSVTVGGNSVKLAIDSNMSTNLRIDHDGAFNFTFYGSNEVRRAALFTNALELIEHYVFPAASGGKIMTVTPAGAASRPNAGPPATTIGTATASGDTSAADTETKAYTVTTGGDASNLTYQWGVGGDASIASGGTSATVQILFTYNTGAGGVTCVVTSGDAGVTDSPATSNTVNVTVSA